MCDLPKEYRGQKCSNKGKDNNTVKVTKAAKALVVWLQK